jgi:hypothetical protein
MAEKAVPHKEERLFSYPKKKHSPNLAIRLPNNFELLHMKGYFKVL